MITYPVPANSRWAVYDLTLETVIKHNQPWPVKDGAEIPKLAPNLVLLREVQVVQPDYDSATEQLRRTTPVVNIFANTHTHGWEVLPRSQEDLDTEAEREQIKSMYLALKNGTGTQGERFLRVEKVLAHLLKQYYGSE